MEKFNIEIINWKWESKILKITKGDSYTCDDLSSKITELELLVNDKINHIRTLHIHVDENILHQVIPLLIKTRYIFRAYIDGFYQYYKWLLDNVEDKVHPYATSTAGASAMILSPDELSVLLIFENNNWKFVTGSNSFKELSFDTAKREMFEEVGLVPDPDFIPKVIGFWNIGGRCGGEINDMMTSYVFRSMPNCEIKMDEFELCDAKWFKISDLEPIINLALSLNFEKIPEPINNHVITYDGQNYGYPYMLWLHNWLKKKYFDINVVANINILT